jgi:hypothetical protein
LQWIKTGAILMTVGEIDIPEFDPKHFDTENHPVPANPHRLLTGRERKSHCPDALHSFAGIVCLSMYALRIQVSRYDQRRNSCKTIANE